MDERDILQRTANWVENLFRNDTTGHDFWHIKRVVNLAEIIARKEKANLFICQMAAYLHDVLDEKMTEDLKHSEKELHNFLATLKLPNELEVKIIEAMEDVSFKGHHRTPKTLEGKIVQDADRLDAIGAIGIARTFTYGGSKGNEMHNPKVEQLLANTNYRDHHKTTIYHFYEKLLKLKDLMNTKAAKEVAEQRHHFMELFLVQFYKEWEGSDL